MEQWLDGDRSSGPVKAFIAAHDRATRQGANGHTLIAEVVDRVVTRRADGVDADLGGFMASIAPMATSNSPTCGHPNSPSAGRVDYASAVVLRAMRAAASLSL